MRNIYYYKKTECETSQREPKSSSSRLKLVSGIVTCQRMHRSSNT
jgi:hypothetical protein